MDLDHGAVRVALFGVSFLLGITFGMWLVSTSMTDSLERCLALVQV